MWLKLLVISFASTHVFTLSNHHPTDLNVWGIIVMLKWMESTQNVACGTMPSGCLMGFESFNQPYLIFFFQNDSQEVFKLLCFQICEMKTDSQIAYCCNNCRLHVSVRTYNILNDSVVVIGTVAITTLYKQVIFKHNIVSVISCPSVVNWGLAINGLFDEYKGL